MDCVIPLSFEHYISLLLISDGIDPSLINISYSNEWLSSLYGLVDSASTRSVSVHLIALFVRTFPPSMFNDWCFRKWTRRQNSFMITSSVSTSLCRIFVLPDKRCSRFTCKFCNIVQYRFAVPSVRNRPIRTVAVKKREGQTCLNSHWLKYIEPIRICRILCMNAWLVGNLERMGFPSNVIFHCLHLLKSRWDYSSAHW